MRSRLPVALGFLFFLFGNASSQTLDHDAHPLAPPVRIPHAVLFDTSTFHGFVSPHERKLETSVRDLLRVADLHHDSLVSGPPSPLDIQSWGKVDTNGKIHVYLRIKEGYEASSGIDSLLKLAPPVYPTAYKPRMRRIPVWLTASQIRQAITWNNIRHVRLVSYPHFNTGDVMSQGVSRIRADFISQIWPKATGAGVRVGVISDDCGSLPTDVAPKVGGTVLHSQLSELSPNPLIVDDSYTGSRPARRLRSRPQASRSPNLQRTSANLPLPDARSSSMIIPTSPNHFSRTTNLPPPSNTRY
jgi:hypothetical protein